MSSKERDSLSSRGYSWKQIIALGLLSIMGGGGYYEVRGQLKEALPINYETRIKVIETKQVNDKEHLERINGKMDILQSGQTRILELLIERNP